MCVKLATYYSTARPVIIIMLVLNKRLKPCFEHHSNIHDLVLRLLYFTLTLLSPDLSPCLRREKTSDL